MAWTLIADANTGGLNGGTTSAIDTTGADLFVLFAAFANGSPTVSDSQGNTWTALTSRAAGSNRARLYYCIGPTTNASHTFTFTATGLAGAFSIQAWSSGGGTPVFDVESGGSATATTSGVGSNLTPTQNDALVIIGVGLAASVSSFAAAGANTLVNHANFVGGTSYGVGDGYIHQSTAATISAATTLFSWTTSVSAIAAAAAFTGMGGGGGGGGLTSGTASLTSATDAAINLSVGAASGGTSPYSYAWERRTTADAAFGSGTSVGTDSTTLSDTTATTDTTYFYQCRVTDDVAATADSNTVGGCLLHDPLKIGFIGDSITNGYGLSAGQDPAVQCGIILERTYRVKAVTVSEYGVNGSAANDWTSTAGGTNYTLAEAQFAAAGCTHVHVMLGANDAAEHQSAATFGTNLDTICDNLIADGYTVILSYPIYIPAGANGGATDAAAVDLAIAYRSQIDSLINGTTILRGDTIAWQHFLLNNDEMQSDDTHPTAAGAVSLGAMWARAIDRSVLQVASGSSGGVTRARSGSGLGAMG